MSDTGYRRPPTSSRFARGTSGNPKGRPRGRNNRPPYEAVLGQKVLVRESGSERRVTAAEAFLLYLTKRGLEGDGAAARSAATVIEKARSVRESPDQAGNIKFTINIGFVGPGTVNTVLTTLRMATKLDRYRPSARMALEPWLVQAALARLGDRRLTITEQEAVVDATRTPGKVAWPEWWSIMPRGGA